MTGRGTSTVDDSADAPDLRQFVLPDVGEGLTEATVVTWRVAVGDVVAINDIVVEIETEKSLVELPSPFAGTVSALLVKEDITVPVGTPLLSIRDGGRYVRETPDEVSTAATRTDEPAPSVLVGYGPTKQSTTRRRRRNVDHAESAVTPTESNRAVTAKPPVRKLAKDRGIALADIVASGPNGLVTRQDVLAHESSYREAATPGVEMNPPELRSADETRQPIRGVRKHTAEAMVKSAFTAPHVSEFLTIDITATMDLLAELKTFPQFDEVKLTPLTLVAKAVLVALRSSPTLNSEWDEALQEIVLRKRVNLGIAAATPRGLMVPNIKDADGLTFGELARALEALTRRARDGAIAPADLASGTITITNIGGFGVDSATPILNPGEAAILCLGAISRRPWVVEEQVVVRSVTTLALSFDHRLVDGEQGSKFLSDLGRILTNPHVLIAQS